MAGLVLFACTPERPEGQHDGCGTHLGEFLYPEFERNFEEDPSPSTCNPCIARGGTFAIEFVTAGPVSGEASIRTASSDYLVELGAGLLRAEREGTASVIAWADDRVVGVESLEVHAAIDITILDVHDEEVSVLQLDSGEEDLLHATPIFDDDLGCEPIGSLEATVTTDDAAVATATPSADGVRVQAVGPGTTELRIEAGGIVRAIRVNVDEPERDT